MGGLTIEKMFIILVIALVILGPERLPEYSQKLAILVKNIRRLTLTAKERIQEEMGEDFTDEDWAQLDPRQYDPRRIIRQAIDDDKRETEVLARQQAAREAAALRKEAAAAKGVAEPVTVGEAAAMDLAVKTKERKLYFDDEAT